MKKIYSGCFAVSIKGHDTDLVYVVINEDDEYVYLANGKHRPVENPKKKKKKHIRCFFNEKLNEYISIDTPITDGRLRRAVRSFIDKYQKKADLMENSSCREEE